MRSLERAHPLVSFLYLVAVMGMTVFTRSPVLAVQSAVGASLLLMLSGSGRLALMIPLFAAASALTNPIFSHNGVTVLFFVNDLPVTAEAVVYGAVFGAVLAAACAWGVCAVRFVTSDKYIWLFGRILPSAGLVLSCALRFLPLLTRRARSFAAVQGAATLKQQLHTFSACVGYSAELAMSSADSMNARGYGSAQRTSYSVYSFGRRECIALAAVILLSVAAVVMTVLGGGEFFYYPALSELKTRPADIALYISFGALTLLPTAVILREKMKILNIE